MLWEIIILALALSTDSFCLSLGLAVQGICKLRAWLFTISVGLLHILFPLGGLSLGRFAQTFLGTFARPLGAFVLIGVGIKVIYDGLRKDSRQRVLFNNSWYLLLMALAVSVDSLVVGFGLGTFGFSCLAATIVFGLTTVVLTRLGFYFGDYLKCRAKNIDFLTGLVLIALGLKALF